MQLNDIYISYNTHFMYEYCSIEQETHQGMRIPERDVTHIILSVYLLMLIHRYPLNRKQSH